MKISPYDIKGVPLDLIYFKDEVTTLLNYGKYQNTVLYEGTPTWTGREGEQAYAYFDSGGGQYIMRLYVYANSAWRATFWTAATG